MNITIVKDTILPVKHYGGTERVIWALGKELSAMGHQVHFWYISVHHVLLLE